MGKRKTLAKNKRKKRQTKKTSIKKYIGGDIKQILENVNKVDVDLYREMYNCINTGNVCEKVKVFSKIKKFLSKWGTIFTKNDISDLTSFFDKSLLDQNKYHVIALKEDDKKRQQRQQRQQTIDFETGANESQEVRNQMALQKMDSVHKPEILSHVDRLREEREEAAIQKFEGRTDAWNEIQKLLTMKCNRREESGGLQLGDSKNYQTQEEAIAIITSAQSLLSKLQTDTDFFKKKKNFYELLYNFGINCHQFKHVQNLALRDCLNYDCYQIISSLTEQKYSNYSIFLTNLNSNNKYYYEHIFTNSNSEKIKTGIWIFLLDIELIVDLILNLHQKIVFNLDDALKPNTIKTTKSFLLNLLKKFLKSSLPKFNSIEISRTWEEDLKSLVNIIFESVYEVTKRLTKYNATFLVDGYSTLVNEHILKTLDISCKILTFKRQWYGENTKTCADKIQEDRTYLKIKNFMESVLEAITRPGSKITPL